MMAIRKFVMWLRYVVTVIKIKQKLDNTSYNSIIWIEQNS